MNSSAHVNNRKKDILILAKGPTQGLGEQKKYNQLILL